MRDYFHNNDRVPYDSCPEYEGSNVAPYTELTILDERMMDVSPIIWEQLRKMPICYEVMYRLKVLICDAYEDGVKDGVEQGVQQVVDDPQHFFAKGMFQ